ncbi:glycoside hydrolase domain-containing protein [Paenibacillus sp. HJGM_3]|uniref:glycoside hydrolase domain-containing protein n=1 Tax=Paenibacillus sp. HJGM_3 TaxID=3379816 RepID=UPI00385D49C5
MFNKLKRRQGVSMLLFVCLLVNSLSWPGSFSVAGAADADNLLLNGDFEQQGANGKPLNWSAFQPASVFESVSSPVHGGNLSVKLTSKGANGVRSAKIPVTAGNIYTATLHSFNESGASSLYLEFWNSSNVRIAVKTQDNLERGTWIQQKLMMQAPAGAVTATVLQYQGAANTGVTYIDDAAFVMSKPVSTPFAALKLSSLSPGVTESTYGEARIIETTGPDQFAVFELPVELAGQYEVRIEGGTDAAGGIADVSVDDNSIGTMNFYGSSGGDTLPIAKTVHLSSGIRELKLVSKVKQAESEGYRLWPKRIILTLKQYDNALESISLRLASGKSKLAVGDTDSITVSGKMTDGGLGDLATAQIVYESGNTNLVTVDGAGKLTAVGAGSTNIKVTVTKDGVTRNASLPVRMISAAGKADNILFNGGLEKATNGKPDGWVSYNNDSVFATVNNPVHSGSSSVKLTSNGANGLRSAPIKVVPGVTYKASSYSYNQSGVSSLYLEFWNANNQRIGVKTANNNEIGKWVYTENIMSAPVGTVTATVLLYQTTGNKGITYYDDVELTVIPSYYVFEEMKQSDRSPGLIMGSVGESLRIESTAVGQYAEFELPVVVSGRYKIRLTGATSPHGGVADIQIDGQTMGTLDFYGSGEVGEGESVLDVSAALDPGLHRLKLQVSGKNGQSGGYHMLPIQVSLVLDVLDEYKNKLNGKIAEVRSELDHVKANLLPGSASEDVSLATQAAQLDQRLITLVQQSGQPDISMDILFDLIDDADDMIWEVKRLANFVEARKARPTAPFGLAASDSMTIVYPNDLPCLCSTMPNRLSLAGGEYENIQAAVLAYDKTLHNVKSAVQSITGPDGAAVASSMLEATVAPLGSVMIRPAGYTLPKLANSPGNYHSWTPDPIRSDLASVDIPAGTIQPYWVEIHAASHAQPGNYRVTVTFEADGIPVQTLDIDVTVWPFSIQERPILPTSMSSNPVNIYSTYGLTDPDEKKQMWNKYVDFLETYKIEPDLIYRGTPPTVEELQRIDDKWGLKQFNILYIDPRVGFDLSKPETWQARIDMFLTKIGTALAEYEQAGFADRAYVYGFDEATGQYATLAKTILQQLNDRFPNLPVMTTYWGDRTYGEASGLSGLFDIWVPLVDDIDHNAKVRAQQRGDKVYWYIAVGVRDPFPNWFNGYQPSDTRVLMGPLSYKRDVDGFLYYNISRWNNYLPMSDGILSNWNPRTFPGADGDGSLFYPGPEGPLASQRLNNFRDGMEDYNLLSELEIRLNQTAGVPDPVIAQARDLLHTGAVAADETHYTKDPVVYRQWRELVANMIIGLEPYKENASVTYAGDRVADESNDLQLAAQVQRGQNGTPGNLEGLPIRFTIQSIGTDGSRTPVSVPDLKKVYTTDSQGKVTTTIRLPAGLYDVQVDLLDNRFYKTATSAADLAVRSTMDEEVKLNGFIRLPADSLFGGIGEKMHFNVELGTANDEQWRMHVEPQGVDLNISSVDWVIVTGNNEYLQGKMQVGGIEYTVRVSVSHSTRPQKDVVSIQVWSGNDSAGTPLVNLIADFN